MSTLFLRLVMGNVLKPIDPASGLPEEQHVSAHTFRSVLLVWRGGDISKAQGITFLGANDPDDSGDLDLFKQWLDAAHAAGLEEEFLDHVESRIVLANDKRSAAGDDGGFGYAVKSTFVNGADGLHSLADTGPVAQQFVTWAVLPSA